MYLHRVVCCRTSNRNTITEFEAGIFSCKSVQKRFLADTNALISAFEEVGNPFDEVNDEVVILDTKEVLSDETAQSVVSFHDPIKTNKSRFHVGNTKRSVLIRQKMT